MNAASRSRNYRISKLQNRSRGYVLISLMLFLSLLAMAALAVLPSIAFQVRRDREEEMIHRGVQYSRAIKRYYKKLGRYPTRIEELENTNNVRYLRKRYKDPMNVVEGKEQDFKILRMTDVQLGLGGLGGIPGVGGAPGQGLPGGGNAPGLTQLNAQQAAAAQAVVAQLQQQQQQQPTADSNPNAAAAAPDTSETPEGEPGAAASPTKSGNSAPGPSPSPSATSGFGGPQFGGGAMLGVRSANKKQTVREFCKKSHYNDWNFLYDPSSDRGGTITTPYCQDAFGQPVNLNQNPNAAGPQPNAAPPPGNNPGVQQNPANQMPPEQ